MIIITLISLFSCFKSLVSDTGSYTEDEPKIPSPLINMFWEIQYDLWQLQKNFQWKKKQFNSELSISFSTCMDTRVHPVFVAGKFFPFKMYSH